MSQSHTELAEQAGLAVGKSVFVDAALRTEDPDVYDVANMPNPRYGARIHVEHWAVEHWAVEHWADALHGRPAAARSMLGQQVSYDRAPYFFTDQYDVDMEFAGWFPPGGYDALVARGDLEARAFHAFWLADDWVVAGGTSTSGTRAAPPMLDLIRSGVPAARHRLAEPGVPLADTTKS